MATRSVAADLVRLLDAAAGPVYALDDKRRILFVNEACAAWAGCPATELVGQECRYHSSDETVGPAAIAASLCPPPEAWSGCRVTATVSLAAPDGSEVARRVEFVPLGSDALEITGVVAFAATEPCDPSAGDNAPSDEAATAAVLHERLRRWRHTLAGRYAVDRLLGDSPAMRLVRRKVELAAAARASVSIVGPAGSGRQHVARAIHYGTSFSTAGTAGALVPLVCPVLTMSLLDSTIRTLERASAAAPAKRPATLLLSEVDSLNLEAQEQLARSLSSTTAYRVVSTAREPLEALVAAGRFLPELSALLSTIEIQLPALVERPGDIPVLAQLFVEEHNRQNAKQLSGFTPEALERLAACPFRNNVDELADVVATACRSADGPFITPGDLPAKVHVALDAAAHPRRREQTIVLEKFLAEIEEELIRRAMKTARGNKAKAARLLGMTRPRLYRRLVQLGLEKPAE